MTVGLDTSVVLRLLTGEPASQAHAALGWLREAKASGTTPVIPSKERRARVAAETRRERWSDRVPGAGIERAIAKYADDRDRAWTTNALVEMDVGAVRSRARREAGEGNQAQEAHHRTVTSSSP